MSTMSDMPDCTVRAACPVNLSEDPGKVEAAVSNVLLDCTVSYENYSVMASGGIHSLEKVRESVVSRQLRNAYKRTLEQNAGRSATWFYLNKQAAYARKVALCEEAGESPLGPIKVSITSDDLDKVVRLITGGRKIG